MQGIFLIGFMGAGKTTFGKKLAAKLSIQFQDLDDAVCAKYKAKSIKDLIEVKGFEFFRIAENETLKSLSAENKVIATGGGTPCYLDALEWMKGNGTVVFLNVPEGVIFSRLKTTELHERPLLKNLDDEGLKNFIHEKLAERLPFYNQARIHFDPVHQPIEELIELIGKLG